MSMLAAPRCKQKVVNLRAKNNAWSNDSNKFGQRMLEKMGWSSGKGLGANENGIVEHVVARYKNDEKGLGFEDKNDQWTKHEDDFNILLANLSNADSGTEPLHSGVSLEKKSKKSKTRIHYHKFTRGKDLSRYTEKDLANIFGKKSFKETKLEETVKEDAIITEQVFTEKGNMDDYFKDKMAAFKSKLVNTNNKIIEDHVSEYGFNGFSIPSQLESENVSDGFGPISLFSSEKVEIMENNVESTPCQDVEITRTKKRNKSKKVHGCSKEEEIDNSTESLQESNQYKDIESQSATGKKSKNKKPKKCADNELQSKSKVKYSGEENDIFVENNIPKKKKKRKNHDL